MLDRLRVDLTAAMKARDAVAVSALRSAIAAIGNAEAVEIAPDTTSATGGRHVAGSVPGLGAGEAPRRVLSEADMAAIIREQVDERMTAAEHYDRIGDAVRATRLRAEAGLLAAYLPSASASAQPPYDRDPSGDGGDQSARRPKNAR